MRYSNKSTVPMMSCASTISCMGLMLLHTLKMTEFMLMQRPVSTAKSTDSQSGLLLSLSWSYCSSFRPTQNTPSMISSIPHKVIEPTCCYQNTLKIIVVNTTELTNSPAIMP